jgi:hypothetical protein
MQQLVNLTNMVSIPFRQFAYIYNHHANHLTQYHPCSTIYRNSIDTFFRNKKMKVDNYLIKSISCNRD